LRPTSRSTLFPYTTLFRSLSFGVANLVSSGTTPELSLPAVGMVKEFDLIVNARVAAAPEVVEEQVRRHVTAACEAAGARAEFRTDRKSTRLNSSHLGISYA